MSKYTTGEIAKLCGVTVRTVQYYDTRKILVPSQLSEGGRRLYSEDDLKRMKVICFLRELDIPISAIGELLEEDHPEDVIHLLLQQQELLLKEEIGSRQEKLQRLQALRQDIQKTEQFSIETIGDIAHIMENKNKLRRMRWTMVGVGLISEAVEIATILLWIFKGIWWPFVFVALPVMIVISVWISRYYFKNVAYICPKCHSVFKPSFKEMFWANHTPTTRKLRCPECGHKGFCVEVYSKEKRS